MPQCTLKSSSTKSSWDAVLCPKYVVLKRMYVHTCIRQKALEVGLGCGRFSGLLW